MARKSKKEEQTKTAEENKETSQKEPVQEGQTQAVKENPPKKEPVMYVGEPVVNERFFLRPGQVFMEIPAYVKDKELRKKFIPVSQVKNKQNQ
ncbi:hypothetical protein [Persephonella sp.]